MDPVSTKADELSGQVMAKIGELPPIWSELKVDLELLKFMVSGLLRAVVKFDHFNQMKC